MRRLVILSLLALIAACGPAKPISDSEFKGFCYQYDSGPHTDCVPIHTCDEYLSVIGVEQPSLEACLEGCQGIYRNQARNQGFTGCLGAPGNARDWCQRVCRSRYPNVK